MEDCSSIESGEDLPVYRIVLRCNDCNEPLTTVAANINEAQAITNATQEFMFGHPEGLNGIPECKKAGGGRSETSYKFISCEEIHYE